MPRRQGAPAKEKRHGIGALIGLSLLIASLAAGCLADGSGGSCSTELAFTARLVFEQPGIYQDLETAMADANETSEADWHHEKQQVWRGVRGVSTRVTVGPVQHGYYEAVPQAAPDLVVDHPGLEAYGTVWVDRVQWRPIDDMRTSLHYNPPENQTDEHEVVRVFGHGVSNQSQGADLVKRFTRAMFPEDDYEPTEDPDFEDAWSVATSRTPEGQARVGAFVAELLDTGAFQLTQAPFEGRTLSHAVGGLRLYANDPGDWPGPISVELGHDLRTLSLDEAEPRLTLEATPADVAFLSTFAPEPIGKQALVDQATDRFASTDASLSLDLDEAHYDVGGTRSVQTGEGPCGPMKVVGQPVTGEASGLPTLPK